MDPASFVLSRGEDRLEESNGGMDAHPHRSVYGSGRRGISDRLEFEMDLPLSKASRCLIVPLFQFYFVP